MGQAQSFNLVNFDIADLITASILCLDSAGRILFANTSAETLFGLSKVQLAKLKVEDLLHSSEEFHDFCNTNKEESSHIQIKLEWNLARGENAKLDTMITQTGMLYPSCVVELRTDLRSIKVSKEERRADLVKVNKMILKNLGHEVKNPLGGIRGAAQLLKDELVENELVEYTDVIIKEADRLRDLVDNMLISSKRAIKYEKVNIHELTERVRTLVESEYKQISIVCDYDVSIPELECDATQIVQVILNVCRNAAEALQRHDIKNPKITLKSRIARQTTLRRRKHTLAVLLEIKDNGPGVPNSIQDQIFYPLVSSHPNGHGVGLTLAQEIIHAHHGLIDFESREGLTIFSIHIPISKSESVNEFSMDS